MPNILRIDMGGADGPTALLEPDGRYAGRVGRAMTSLAVAEEVDPACHPLGGGNKLVIAPGPSRGSAVSVGCKSPLTGGIAASGAEGPGADALRRLGYAAIVVEGQPAGDDLWTIVVDEAGVAFATANRHRMAGTGETIAALRRAHPASAALLVIGPAGEMALGAASVSSPAGALRLRHCGRGGAGAVMGSKRVKAIVLGGGAPASAAAPGGDPGAGPAASPYRDACGIRDPSLLGRLEALEDDLGLDGAEVAAAVSLATEAGLARPGDGESALRLVEEIGRWTPLGRLVGSGLRAVAEAFGLEERISALRGDGSEGALASAEAELGRAAPEVVEAERGFLARARVAAAAADARLGDPGVPLHPIVFGAVDDDVARLFGSLDPDADPFDPQLQLPVGLRPRPAERRRLPGPVRRLTHRN